MILAHRYMTLKSTGPLSVVTTASSVVPSAFRVVLPRRSCMLPSGVSTDSWMWIPLSKEGRNNFRNQLAQSDFTISLSTNSDPTNNCKTFQFDFGMRTELPSSSTIVPILDWNYQQYERSKNKSRNIRGLPLLQNPGSWACSCSNLLHLIEMYDNYMLEGAGKMKTMAIFWTRIVGSNTNRSGAGAGLSSNLSFSLLFALAPHRHYATQLTTLITHSLMHQFIETAYTVNGMSWIN